MKLPAKIQTSIPALLIAFFGCVAAISAQSYMTDIKRDSARSDKRTGGKIETTALVPGAGNLELTLNVPAFQLTLWQNGKEVKSYPVGVGMKEFPIYIGFRAASEIIWNPDWIPPSSDWVEGSKTVKVGEIIRASDKRNPLGKVKIPLGLGYLIHQARGAEDLGNLVSHGCVRVMQPDLYDLSEKIVAGRALSITPDEIANAKSTKNTVVAEIDEPVPVEITYDTLVVESNRLHIYPDVYDYHKNTVENLRAELESNNVNTSRVNDETLEKMLAAAGGGKQFVVGVKNISGGQPLKYGQIISVLSQPGEQKIQNSPRNSTRKVVRKN